MYQGSIKVVGLSDLHGYLFDPREVPECDVVCICGDILPLEYQKSMISSIAWLCGSFFPWCERLNCKKVLFTWGNHDFIGQYLHYNMNPYREYEHNSPLSRSSSAVMKKLLKDSWSGKVTLLHDAMYEYKGYVFYGTAWCPDLVNWAFYGDSDKLKKQFSQIPHNCDILLTHCPPRVENFGTVLQNNAFNWMVDYGCQELADEVFNKKVKYHIFGHVHSGTHSMIDINGTNFCNVSNKDENYRLYYEPRLFEVDSKQYNKKGES